MKIQKLIHSCLLVEENGKRILIDPGTWSFGDGALKVSDVPKVDVILITHKHADHCFPDAIKQFVLRDSSAIYCPSDANFHLSEAGVTAKAVSVPQIFNIADFTVATQVGNHEPLPVAIPENVVYLINNKLLHPGDSHSFEAPSTGAPEVLALPIMAPWGSLTNAVKIALRMKPKHVIPIHDAFVKEPFLLSMYNVCANALASAGIQFHPLKIGETFEI